MSMQWIIKTYFITNHNRIDSNRSMIKTKLFQIQLTNLLQLLFFISLSHSLSVSLSLNLILKKAQKRGGLDLSGISAGGAKLKRTVVQESTGAAQKEDLSNYGKIFF